MKCQVCKGRGFYTSDIPVHLDTSTGNHPFYFVVECDACLGKGTPETDRHDQDSRDDFQETVDAYNKD